MNFLRKIKKAFTLIELVVVIAVIAILTTISVVSYLSITNNAKKSNDQQLVDFVNTSLIAHEIMPDEGKPKYMDQAVDQIFSDGFSVEKFRGAEYNKYEYIYNSHINRFGILENGKDLVYPKGIDEKDTWSDIWRFADSNSKVAKLDGKSFSYYLLDGCSGDINAPGGIDVGKNTKITSVNYVNSDGEQDVVIRTNTFGTKLTVNGSADDTVTHYGFAGLVEVTRVAKSSYDEYGVVGRLSATAAGAIGHLDIKAGATVYQIEQLGGDSTTVTVDAAATVYDINHEKVEGAVAETNARFTETAGITVTTVNANGERIVGKVCTHEHSEDVIDGQHVYEVCKTCGYTVIKVGSNKMIVDDASDNNVIIPKAAYGTGSNQVVSTDGNSVKLVEDASTETGYVEPEIESTPVVDPEKPVDITCQHSWKYTSNDDGTHNVNCSKCNAAYSENCDNKGANGACSKCGYTSVMPEFASGSGTEDDPWIISNREQFFNINNHSNDDEPHYWKCEKDLVINASCWTSINLYGAIDGNGLTITKLDAPLFDDISSNKNTYIKNMDVTCNIIAFSWTGAIANSACVGVDFINVDVHGTIQGATGVSSYLGFCYGGYYKDYYGGTNEYSFKNCESNATIIATTGSSAGFVCHPMAGSSYKTIITIEDSCFEGKLINGKCYFATNYMEYNNTNQYIKVKYSQQYFDAHEIGSNYTYYVGSAKTNPTVGEYILSTQNGQGYNDCIYSGPTKSGVGSATISELGEKGSVITCSKSNNATYAIAYLLISPNDTNNEGCYTATYLTEVINIDSQASSFSTSLIKNFNIAINPEGVATTGAVEDTFNVVNSFYGHSHAGATVTIIQYTEKGGDILSVTSKKIADANAFGVELYCSGYADWDSIGTAIKGYDFVIDCPVAISSITGVSEFYYGALESTDYVLDAEKGTVTIKASTIDAIYASKGKSTLYFSINYSN